MLFFKICLLLSSILIASVDMSVLRPKPRLDGRIVGGVEIDIRDAPWQITMQTKGRHFCGGSIIGAKWILTAAHCTMEDENNPENILIKSGTSLHREGTITQVKRIVAHPKYDDVTVDYDFALLELETELELGETRKAIKLPENKIIKQYSDGTMCLVTGWGKTQNSKESMKKLRAAEVPIYPQDKCQKAYREQGGITERMLCAGFKKGGKDACQGDSGGPLAVYTGDKTREAELVGVVSWGEGCAQPKYPGVYARVQSVREWISEVTSI